MNHSPTPGPSGPDDTNTPCDGGNAPKIQVTIYNSHTTTHVGEATACNLAPNHGSVHQEVHEAQTTPPVPASSLAHPAGKLVPASTICNLTNPHSFTPGSFLAILDPIPDASHRRNLKLSPPNSRCFAGTREKVSDIIRTWMDTSILLKNPHIMWVYGYAGCGKSAIAQGIAEYYAEMNRLAASFFFFRGPGDRNRVARFAATIASQVAAAIPATEPVIEAVIKRNAGILSTSFSSLTAQFRALVYDPINRVKWDQLAAALRRGPFLIVLDGLDECDDHDDIVAFIKDMIEYFNSTPSIPLRFLITSRVETHLHRYLHSSKQVKLLDLVKHTSDADISAALDTAIAEEKLDRSFAGDPSWPCRDDRLKLVDHIGGSFIFMTTILKSLFDPSTTDGLTPMERLPRLLSMRPDFDQLYGKVLGTSKDLPQFDSVVRTVILSLEPLSIASIAALLGIDTYVVTRVLVNLHAIMQIPGDDHASITLWHTSLRDFLCSEERAGLFFANPEHHRLLAFRCISLTSSATVNVASDYARRFATEHWARFLQSMDGDTDKFNENLDETMAGLHGCLQVDTMTTDFHISILAKILEHATKKGQRVHARTRGEGWTALEIVVRSRNWEGLRALSDVIDFRDRFRDGSTALEVIVCSGQWQGLTILIPAGSSVLNEAFGDGLTALETIVRGKEWEGLRLMVRAGPDVFNQAFRDGSTALEAVALAEMWDGLEILLGAEPKAWNRTLTDGRSVFQVLITNDELWNQIRPGLGGTDSSQPDINAPLACGHTALEVACRAKKWKLVRVLVAAHADVNVRFRESEDGIIVALHAACHFREREMVVFLLENGANPNIVAPRSWDPKSWGWYAYPLAFAATRGDVHLVRLLVARGADPALEGGWYGSTPSLCEYLGWTHVARVLYQPTSGMEECPLPGSRWHTDDHFQLSHDSSPYLGDHPSSDLSPLPYLKALVGGIRRQEIADSHHIVRATRIKDPPQGCEIPCFSIVAPCFGVAGPGQQLLRDTLEVFVNSALSSLEVGLRVQSGEILPWSTVREAFTQSPYLMLDSSKTIDKHRLFQRETREGPFASTGDECNKRVQKEVEEWLWELLNDSDVCLSTKIPIEQIADIVTCTNSLRDDNPETRRVEKIFVEVGILRYPDFSNPHIRIYRIKLIAWGSSKRKALRIENRSGIRGHFLAYHFDPRDEFIQLECQMALKLELERQMALEVVDPLSA